MTEKCKLSFDLLDENKQILDTIKNEKKISYGGFINTLISLFGGMPQNIKYEMFQFCEKNIRDFEGKIKNAGEFEYGELAYKISLYKDLAAFFEDEKTSIAKIKPPVRMKTIKINDGILLYPADYILLNIDDAPVSKFVSVVEVRDAKYRVPHFVYFSNTKVYQYTDHLINIIYEHCIEKWPKFQEIIDGLVDPIWETDDKTVCINMDEYAKSPKIGHFSVYVDGDTNYPRNYEPPAGMKIVRDNK